MQMGAGVAQLGHQANVALDHADSASGHAAQAQLERHRPGVHAGALGQARVFGVLDDAQAPRAPRRPASRA
jgi:hypothetical protein